MANTRFPRIKTDPAQYTKQEFSKTWESSEDFPTIELSEAQVRRDMQCLHDEMKDHVNGTLVNDVAQSFDAVADELIGVVKSINLKTADDDGAINLTAADVGAVPVGEGGIIGVASVNGRAGSVELSKADVGLGDLDNARQYSALNPPPYPVASVNGKTGEVALTADDIHARPDTWTPTKSNIGLGLVVNERQYSAQNPPPYPVTSVNGETGDVQVQGAIAVGTISLTALWETHGDYFTQPLTATLPANIKVDLQPDHVVTNRMVEDGVISLYIENLDGTLTAYATGAAPTAAMTVQCTFTEVLA